MNRAAKQLVWWFAFLLLAQSVLAEPVAEEVTLEYQGLRLNALYQKGEDGPVILILHGTLGHNEMDVLKGIRGVFAEEGVATLAVNLSLGVDNRHGMYDCATPHRHQHRDALLEVQQWINWLKQKGHNTIVLFGHSRGGNQIAMYLADNPDPAVKAGVLLAPMLETPDSIAAAYKKRFGMSVDGVLTQARELVGNGKGDQMMDKVGLLYCEPGKTSAASFVSYYSDDPGFYTPRLFKKINRPLLVIEGTADDVVTGLGDAFAAAETRDDQELVSVEGADHFFRDLYAYDVAEAVTDFLDRQL